MSGAKQKIRLGRAGPRAPRAWILREGRSEYLEAIRWVEIQAAERRGEEIIQNQAAEIGDAVRRGAACLIRADTYVDGSDYAAGRIIRSVLVDLRERARYLTPDERGIEAWAAEHDLGDAWAIEAIRNTLALWAESATSMRQLAWSRHASRQTALSYERLDPPRAESFGTLEAYLEAAERYYRETRRRQAGAGWEATRERDLEAFQWLAEYQVFGLDYATIADVRSAGESRKYHLDRYRKGIENRASLIGVTLRNR